MQRGKKLIIDKPIAQKITEFMIWDYRPYFRTKSNETNQTKILCSVETIHLLSIILSEAERNKDNLKGYYAQIGAGELSNNIHKILGPTAIRDRLILLARYWFISCDNSAPKKILPNGKEQKEKCIIRPNPAFKIMFEPRQFKTKKQFKESSIAIGDNREDYQQGLGMTVHYGYPEHPNFKIEDLNYGEQALDDFENTAADKKQKDAERKELKKHNDAFVECAANLWKAARSRLGHGFEDPIWKGESKDLSPSGKTLRLELTKTFERVGGYVAALSWYIYVMGKPEKDQKGKLVFDLKIPHRQFKGSDFKPSGYGKHFDAIIADPDFKYLSQEGWNDFKNCLTNYFSKELLEVGPKDGTAYSAKLGYVFGEKPLPKLENQSQ